MGWRDFREFLTEVEKRGDVKVVEGATWSGREATS